MRRKSDDAKLIDDFRAAAVDYGEALEIGDHRVANKWARLGGKLKKEIVARGNPAVADLIKLLGDDEPWIRYAAAASTLDLEPERAYRVLAELQALPKAIGSAAFTAMRMWETGALPARDTGT
jgi:HEAT repeat protein